MIFNECGIVVGSSNVLAVSERKLASLIEQDLLEINNIFQCAILNEGLDIKGLINKAIEKIKEFGRWIAKKVKEIIDKIKQKFDPVISKIKSNKNKIEKKFGNMSEDELEYIFSESSTILNEASCNDFINTLTREFKENEKLVRDHINHIGYVGVVSDWPKCKDFNGYVYTDLRHRYPDEVIHELEDTIEGLKRKLFGKNAEFKDIYWMSTDGVSIISEVEKISDRLFIDISKCIAELSHKDFSEEKAESLHTYISLSTAITNYITKQSSIIIEAVNYCVNKSTRILNKTMQLALADDED